MTNHDQRFADALCGTDSFETAPEKYVPHSPARKLKTRDIDEPFLRST
jgi:hypothetical protein